jgi:hypothetical protein
VAAAGWALSNVFKFVALKVLYDPDDLRVGDQQPRIPLKMRSTEAMAWIVLAIVAPVAWALLWAMACKNGALLTART